MMGDWLWIGPAERLAIYARDKHVCQLCRRPIGLPGSDMGPSLDHIIPRALGGTHEPGNLRTAHRRCNALRGPRPGPM